MDTLRERPILEARMLISRFRGKRPSYATNLTHFNRLAVLPAVFVNLFPNSQPDLPDHVFGSHTWASSSHPQPKNMFPSHCLLASED